MKKPKIRVDHPNGYSGLLYGESSMLIFKNGEEVMHTGFRNADLQTADDLYKYLDDIPEFMAMLERAAEQGLFSECDDEPDF